METRLCTVDPACPDAGVMREAGEILKNGGLVAFPTETVYGLGGDALNSEASRLIYAAKGRPSDNPLIVHIADWEALAPIVQEVPAGARRLAEAWWPGPLTMIFKKSDRVPYETSGGLETVAVRMPDHPVALALIRAAGGYIAAPSANTSGRPSPTTAGHVAEDLSGRIDMILDGGSVRIGLESTIVDFTEEVPVILRPGFINEEMLKTVLGDVKMDPGLQSEDPAVRPKAPGMRYRHYAPKAELSIVEGTPESVVKYIDERVREAERAGKKAAVMASAETAGAYSAGHVHVMGSLNSDEEIANRLYGVLRSFDEDGTDVIFSEAFDSPRMGQAIMNRLLKAAGHRVISV
ncbi:MAG: L-threonylcarbamoyladenylate synthase [Lachnospiraceae bacterium]|nr:L-threonylcarbamoyladenylate synthase [Lachnospiraceae bacterium]